MRRIFLAFAAAGLFALAGWCQDNALPSLLAHRSELVASSTAAQAEPRSVTVPAETELAVQVLSGIHTQVNHVDDPVIAQLVQPVYVGGQLALPSGSLVDGRITLIRRPGRRHRPAELGMRFDHILLPTGESKPIAAVLTAVDSPATLDFRIDAEGHLIGGRKSSWKALFGGVAGLGAFGVVRAAMVGATAASAITPIGGAALFGAGILWPHGKEVNLPPSTRGRVRLNNPLTLRVAW